jgi:hypothetical protein
MKSQLTKVTDIIKALASELPFSDSDVWEKLIDQLNNINDSQESGVYEGKLISFAKFDGYALYYIEKIFKNKIKVIHISEYYDGYISDIFNEGGKFSKSKITKIVNKQDYNFKMINILNN